MIVEWLKEKLELGQEPKPRSTEAEDKVDRLHEETERILLRANLQNVRSSRTITSWCDLYGRADDAH